MSRFAPDFAALSSAVSDVLTATANFDTPSPVAAAYRSPFDSSSPAYAATSSCSSSQRQISARDALACMT